MIKRIVGEVLLFFSLLFLVPAIFSLFIKEFIYSLIFDFTSIFLLVIGHAFSKKYKVEKEELIKKPGKLIISVVIVWIILPLFGALPYYYFEKNVLNSIFHSFSAWTTTGFLLKDFNSFPLPLKFWLAFEQWLGGIGIISLVVFVLTQSDVVYGLLKIEGREEIIEFTARHSLIKIFKVYLLLTFLNISVLSFSGLNFLDSLLVSFSTLPTGGVVSIAKLTHEQKIITEIFTIIAAITFSFYVFIQKPENLKIMFKVYENVLFFIFYILFVLVFLFLIFPSNFFDLAFHAISALTTSGFSYVSLNKFSIHILIILMAIGGCVASTAGGIKIDRILILIKGISLRIKQFISARDVVVVERFCNQILDDKTISYAGLILFLYFFTAITFAIILNFEVKNFTYSLFTIVSALSNVGLELGIISNLSIFSKTILILAMFIGRLEIIIPLAFIPALLKKS
ncbi:MAG: potassium transporter TrkG [Candidatus Aenigmatarchaeota archaeon]